jgi:hypothetical protein
MKGFHSDVSHMYGHKHFALVKAAMSISTRGEVVVRLQGARQKEKSPVTFTMAPEDAVRLGAALMEKGSALPRESAEVRDTWG